MIIDGWGDKKVGEYKGSVIYKMPFSFPNSGKVIPSSYGAGEFCVALTKEIAIMREAVVDFDVCIQSAHKWAKEWGGFKDYTTLAYMIINKVITFFPEATAGMDSRARAVYTYWLRRNEYKSGKKEEFMESWWNAVLEHPDLKEFLDEVGKEDN